MRLSGRRSRPTVAQKIWQRLESNSGPLYLLPETLTTRPHGRYYIDILCNICLKYSSNCSYWVNVQRACLRDRKVRNRF
jgi:hypothetical protein